LRESATEAKGDTIMTSITSNKGFFKGDITMVIDSRLYNVWAIQWGCKLGRCYDNKTNMGFWVEGVGDYEVYGIVPLELVGNIEKAKKAGEVVFGKGCIMTSKKAEAQIALLA